MDLFIPLRVFDKAGHAVVAVDESGRVCLCNEEAGRLLGCDPDSAIGSRCWEVMRIRTIGGVPLCSVDCSVQKEARESKAPRLTEVVRTQDDGSLLHLEIFTFLLPSAGVARRPVLHVMKPALLSGIFSQDDTAERSAKAPREDAASWPSTEPATVLPGCQTQDWEGSRADEAAHALSPRQREVLVLLASAMSTHEIAERLGISPSTVRNHVRAVLRKYNFHRQIDVALFWLRQTYAMKGRASEDGERPGACPTPRE